MNYDFVFTVISCALMISLAINGMFTFFIVDALTKKKGK